jgi:signal transduction histidine kinase
VLALIRPIAERRGIGIATRLERATVDGDADRLAELVTNLCANAVEHNRDGGEVTVEVRTDGSAAVLRVSDSGPGIGEADLPRIFERFYRPDAARTRRSGGAGLGLAIAKWIVDAHGGDISCQSSLGKGTEVVVRLPLLKERIVHAS